MKFTEIEEVEVEDARLRVELWFDLKQSSITLEYTCPECGGHGCRFRENACGGGQIRTTIKPDVLKKQFSDEQKKFIIDSLSNILKSLKK